MRSNKALYKNIIIAFVLCILVMFAATEINRPQSALFMPSLVWYIFAFVVLLSLAFIFAKMLALSDTLTYALSFILSYLALMLAGWAINGNSFSNFVVMYHTGKDVWTLVVPFALSNVVMIVWSGIRNKKAFS